MFIDKLQTEEELLKKNEGLVIKIANDYREKYGLAWTIVEDLISEGNIALLKAIRNYNPQIAKLSTYAHKWIYYAMLKYLTQNYFPKLPRERRPKVPTIYNYYFEYYHSDYMKWLEKISKDKAIVIKMIAGLHDGKTYTRIQVKEQLNISLYKIRRIEAWGERDFLNFLGFIY